LKPLTLAQQKTAAQVQQLLKGGNRDQALTQARHLARDAAPCPDAHMLLAMCRAETGDFDGADKAFRRALELAPDHPLILINLGAMRRRAGRPVEAMRAYQRATRRDSSMAAAWLGLGRSARECGELETARSALKQCLKLQPESALAWHELGRVERALEEYEQARESAARAASLAPDQGVYEVNLGVCERLMGRPDSALTSFERASRKGYRGPELDNARIGALLDCGRSEEALKAAQALLQRHPDFVPGYETIADLLWEYGATHGIEDDPADLFRQAIDRQRGHHALRRAFGTFLLKARRNDEAIEVFRELRREADEPNLMMLEANALEAADRVVEAGELYHRTHTLLGDSRPDFLCAYVRHLLRSGEWGQAEARAQAATRLAPTDQEAWAYLATAWRLLGDPREEWLCDYERAITFLEVPAPAGHASRESHLEELVSCLDAMHRASREPIQQSLRRGSQTAGRLFGRPQSIITDTQQALTSTIEGWLSRLPENPEHPFYRRNTGRIRYTGSWSVKLWRSGNHVSHIHPEGWISSAYYVALPPSVSGADPDGEDQSGCIHFGRPPDELGLDLSARRIIRPRVGHLALFPSYMWHGTIPFDDDAPRMTIAFDMRARAR
jgi:Flp pilus assembly protein TadD